MRKTVRSRKPGLALGFGTLAALLGLACPRTPTGAPERVLSTLDAGGGLAYQLDVKSCAQDVCTLEVRLLRGETPLGAHRLAWPSPSRELEEAALGPDLGVGDLLAQPSGTTSWNAAIDDTGFATVARGVRLARDRTGLLVTQHDGVETERRRHELLIADGEQLRVAWRLVEEEVGPRWTATQVLPLGAEQDQVLVTDLYPTGSLGGQEPGDTLTLTTLRWDAGKKKIVESPVDGDVPLQVVTFGSYESVDEAYAAKEEDCLVIYQILPAAPFDGLPSSGYFVGAVTSDAEAARRALADASACNAEILAHIVPFKRRQAP